MTRTLMFPLLLLAGQASATVCNDVPIEKSLLTAKTVFVATILNAMIASDIGTLKTGDNYRVAYTFLVRERFKGNPALVPSLFTINVYNAHDSKIRHGVEDTRLLPGDNVLVIFGKPGDEQVDVCLPSKIWEPNPNTIKLLKALK